MSIPTNKQTADNITACLWCGNYYSEIKMIDGKVCVKCYNLLKNASIKNEEIFLSNANNKRDEKGK